MRPSWRRKITGLLESFYGTRSPAESSSGATGFAGASTATPRSACEAASVSTTAASASARASDCDFPHATAGLLFDLRADRAVFYIRHQTRYFTFKALLQIEKILFEFGDALFLPVDPFGLERTAFDSSCASSSRAWRLISSIFIAAAMEIGDQVARLARFGRKRSSGMLDHTFGKTQDAARFRSRSKCPARRPAAGKWGANSFRRIPWLR